MPDSAPNVASEFAASAPAPRRVGFRTTTGIVIANIIGTGVFTSLGFQVADIQSGFALIFLWIAGGIVALCGALCYSELAAALPRSGGEYHFLSAIYHPALGFMAGFVSATVGFAAPIALAAMAFGKYGEGVLGGTSAIAFSFALVWINALVHLRGLKTGSAFQDLSTIIKILVIAILIGAGFLISPKQSLSFLPQAGDSSAIFSASFAVALVYVMYAYSGWNAASYITSEIEQPERNVTPRALVRHTGGACHIHCAERNLSRHHPDGRDEGASRSGAHRRQTHLRP